MGSDATEVVEVGTGALPPPSLLPTKAVEPAAALLLIIEAPVELLALVTATLVREPTAFELEDHCLSSINFFNPASSESS